MNHLIDNTNQAPKKIYLEFEDEVIPHLNSLKAFALKLTNNPEDADDLVQDTMLKAFRFFDKFEKGTNCKAWLMRIMKNSFINDYRKNLKEPNKVDYEDVQNFYENIKSEDVKSSHIENDAFTNILDDEIVSALSTLPDDYRTIVFLSDIEGYSYDEIAEFLNCPVGTIRSRLHRARKILYALLYTYASKKGAVNKRSAEVEQKEKNLNKQHFYTN